MACWCAGARVYHPPKKRKPRTGIPEMNSPYNNASVNFSTLNNLPRNNFFLNTVNNIETSPTAASIQPNHIHTTEVISIYYHNASSIRNKTDLFRMGILNSNFDVIVITETWLTIRMNSEEYFPSDFIVYRKDRYNFDTSLKGGGVLIAAKNNISSELIACSSSFDGIAVRLRLAQVSVVLVAVYISYGSTIEQINSLINFIGSNVMPLVRDNEHFVIVGDFNLPDLTWFDVDGVLTSSASDETGRILLDFFASLSTTQLNRISNSRGKFLDLLFSNEQLFSEITACKDITGCSSVYHTPITINIFFYDNCEISFSNSYHFNFSNADFISLNEFLDNADWSFLQRGVNLNDAVFSLNTLLNTGIKRFVPLLKSRPRFREPWYNCELVNLEKRHNKLHKRYLIYGDNYYSAFADARKEFANLNWFLFNNYLLSVEKDLTSNPKSFWKFVNDKKKVSGFPSSMNYQGLVADSPKGLCELFAKFFQSVYEPASPSIKLSPDPCVSSDFNHIQFSVEEVLHCLLQLDVNKGTGHDGFPAILFKSCAASLASPITFIFNESLRTSHFPDPWKTSAIHPIFKSGKRNEVSNYRGIAILPVLPKLFESMVQKFLSFHIKPLISSAQHGFLSGRSTVTNLVSFCSHLFRSARSKVQFDVVYTDFAKAFDKIDHAILIAKLEKLNCELIPIKWLQSYLIDRRQYVRISDYSSHYFCATSGVPQGSHIGPLLFIIFINDIISCFKFASCLLFADDLKIFATIANSSDCLRFQSDLDSFCCWSSHNKLLLNIDKCNTMSFYRTRSSISHPYSLNDIIIKRVEYFTDLGVIFSSDLTFTRHIDYTIDRAYVMLGFIKRNCKNFCDPLTLKSLYVAFVRSILEYASPVWSPFYKSHSDRIESVQKQFIIYALRRLPAHDRVNQYALPPYQDRCNLLSLSRLDHRRAIASIIFVRDILSSRIDCADLLAHLNIYAPERRMRRRDGFLYVDASVTNYGLSEPLLSMSRLFNSAYQVFDHHYSRNSFRNVLSNTFF